MKYIIFVTITSICTQLISSETQQIPSLQRLATLACIKDAISPLNEEISLSDLQKIIDKGKKREIATFSSLELMQKIKVQKQKTQTKKLLDIHFHEAYQKIEAYFRKNPRIPTHLMEDTQFFWFIINYFAIKSPLEATKEEITSRLQTIRHTFTYSPLNDRAILNTQKLLAECDTLNHYLDNWQTEGEIHPLVIEKKQTLEWIYRSACDGLFVVKPCVLPFLLEIIRCNNETITISSYAEIGKLKSHSISIDLDKLAVSHSYGSIFINPFFRWPRSLSLQTQLTELAFTMGLATDTLFDELPHEFMHLTNLKKLIFTDNHIKKIDGQIIQCLQQLEYLDLSNNHIACLPNELQLLPLKELMLNKNDLTRIPEIVLKMTALKKVSLAENCIQHKKQMGMRKQLHVRGITTSLIKQRIKRK